MKNYREISEQFATLNLEEKAKFINNYGHYLELFKGVHYSLAIYEIDCVLFVIYYHIATSRIVAVDVQTYRELDWLIDQIQLPGWKSKKGFILEL